MRKEIFQKTNLTCSAGIAATKILAKICSDKNKPNGQFYLPHDRKEMLTFVSNLNVRKIPGIGEVTERMLNAIGITKCGEMVRIEKVN